MKKQSFSNGGMLKTILLYGCCAALVSAVLAMIFAYLIMQQFLNQEISQYLAPIISVISVLICSLLAAKKTVEKKLLVGLGTGAIYFVISLLGKMAFFPGECVNVWRNGLLCLSASLVAVVLTCIPKKKRRFSGIHRR